MLMPQKLNCNKFYYPSLHSNLGKIKAVEVSISILMSTNFKELKSNFGLIKVGFQKGTN